MPQSTQASFSLKQVANRFPLTFVLEFLRLRQYAQLLLKDHQNSGNSVRRLQWIGLQDGRDRYHPFLWYVRPVSGY
jgi:hypothetical protein